MRMGCSPSRIPILGRVIGSSEPIRLPKRLVRSPIGNCNGVYMCFAGRPIWRRGSKVTSLSAVRIMAARPWRSLSLRTLPIYFADLKKQFWLLDTFDGIDRTLLTGKEKAIEGGYLQYGDCFERVKANFAGMDFVNIIRGSVPSTLTHVTADKIAFMHIDMNATVPEIAALEHFWPRLSPFGVLLMDDYGWPRHREQKIGFDGFAKANGLEILQLPTGQGLIIKPPS